MAATRVKGSVLLAFFLLAAAYFIFIVFGIAQDQAEKEERTALSPTLQVEYIEPAIIRDPEDISPRAPEKSAA